MGNDHERLSVQSGILNCNGYTDLPTQFGSAGLLERCFLKSPFKTRRSLEGGLFLH